MLFITFSIFWMTHWIFLRSFFIWKLFSFSSCFQENTLNRLTDCVFNCVVFGDVFHSKLIPYNKQKQNQRNKIKINQGNKQETSELTLIWVFSCLRKIVVWAKEFHVSPNPSWQIILPAKCSVYFENTCKILFEVLFSPAKCFKKYLQKCRNHLQSAVPRNTTPSICQQKEMFICCIIFFFIFLPYFFSNMMNIQVSLE